MCYYKWGPRKCLSLDLANVIVSISKNGGKVPYLLKICLENLTSCEFFPKKEH
jgi:hypothetical protein